MFIISSEKGLVINAGGEEFFNLVPKAEITLDGRLLPWQLQKFEKFSGEEAAWHYTSDEARLHCSVKKTEEGYLFSSRLEAKGALSQVEFFPQSDFNTAGYDSPFINSRGDVGLFYPMTDSQEVSDGFFCPAPMCYVFHMEENAAVVGIGALCKAGYYQMDGFSYHYQDNRFSFSMNYGGKTELTGEYELPDILLIEGNDRFAVLGQYGKAHSRLGYIPEIKKEVQPWWYGPFFCGWGDQWIIGAEKNAEQSAAWDELAVENRAAQKGKKMDTFDYAIAASNEKNYRKMLALAEEKNIPYRVLIIDCKWQKNFGSMEVDTERWGNLRGFIDEQHGKGIHVLLWLNIWSPEGLLPEETVSCGNGKEYVDCTSPVYQKRLQKLMQYLLSAEDGCCNADGFKIDFTKTPTETDGNWQEKNFYGIELLKRRAKQIYDAAKAVKPEALITAQYALPYFEDAMDMMRIGDYHGSSNHACSNLLTRVNAIKAVCPHVLIDTDSPGADRLRDSLAYFRHSVELGVPSIYGIAIYDRFFDQTAWDKVRQWYNAYMEKTEKFFDPSYKQD